MDHNDPSRRQYASHTYTAQQAQPGLAPTSGQYSTPSTAERFRQSVYLQDSPTTPAAPARGSTDAQQVYGFAQGTQYGSTSALPSALQYGQDLQQSPDTQRQQAQSYQQQSSHVVYGMGQPQGGQSPYDTLSSYRTRTNVSSETLASQFGLPQPSQYYLPGPSSHSHPSAPEIPSQHLPSQYAPPEPFAQAGASSAQSYASSLMDPTQAAHYSGYMQQQNPYPTQPQQVTPGTDRYQNQIRTIFSHAHEGTLRDLYSYLNEVSEYLLGNAEQLGLTRDAEELHDDRIRLWQEFNRAWMVTLQRQLDLTQQMVQTNQPLREPQSVMSAQSLERLGHNLVRLCDSIEKHGLVDYEIGVAEEEIMDLLLQCLSILETPADQFGGQEPREPSSGPARGR